MYEQRSYRFIDSETGNALGRSKRLQSQRRLFKKIPHHNSLNTRRRNELQGTIHGSSRLLKVYIEYPILTIKKNLKAIDLGYKVEKITPIGYTSMKL